MGSGPSAIQLHTLLPYSEIEKNKATIIGPLKRSIQALDTLNVKMCPLFQNLLAFLMETKKIGKKVRRRSQRKNGILLI